MFGINLSTILLAVLFLFLLALMGCTAVKVVDIDHGDGDNSCVVFVTGEFDHIFKYKGEECEVNINVDEEQEEEPKLE